MNPYGGYRKNKPDPQEEVKRVRGIIKSGEFAPVHLLYGDEDYLIHQLRDDLVRAMGGGEGSLNYTHYTGKDIDAASVIDLAETLPFLAERRIILIEDSGWFEGGNDEIVEYIKSGVCSSTNIIFCESKVDGKRKLYSAVKEAGVISKILKQDEETLIQWIRGKARSVQLNMDDRDAAYLVSIVGLDMFRLNNEMEKLFSYCMGAGRVTRADVEAICSRSVEDRVFEMCSQIALGNKSETLVMYNDLLTLHEKGYKIIILISRHFDQLLKVKELDNGKLSENEIAEKIGKGSKMGWTINKQYRPELKRFSKGKLRMILELCAQMAEKVLSGSMDENAALEMLVVRLLA